MQTQHVCFELFPLLTNPVVHGARDSHDAGAEVYLPAHLSAGKGSTFAQVESASWSRLGVNSTSLPCSLKKLNSPAVVSQIAVALIHKCLQEPINYSLSKDARAKP